MVLHADAASTRQSLERSTTIDSWPHGNTQLPSNRPGRGGTFRPLVARQHDRSLSAVLADTDPATWVEVVGAVLDRGSALLLSPTTDGGAFSVTLLDGDERSRSYCSSSEEVTACLAALLRICHVDRGQRTDARPSTAKRGR